MAVPLIHHLLDSPMSGAEIERRSFEAIDREAPSHPFSSDEWEVARRMIHTAGDFEVLESLRFSNGAIEAGINALRRGVPIYTDSNMIRSGLSLARLKAVCPDYAPERLRCHVADGEVARLAQESGLPRSLFAVRQAQSVLDGGIAVFGNAPVGLMELSRLIVEEGVRPALVIAMPVGFVHVVESKEEILALGVPCVALCGRRGGSPLAVSVVHALCTLAGRNKDVQDIQLIPKRGDRL